ncbi:hypothetical protein GS424_015865 [Eggerthella guodeyinii]|uniref:Uncharacterized protein n=1 Tax=Eggerthella guodeyinii TaxID=2690837 RepID=A0A6L7IPA5_9ACTN|nr:hypothetical protein [Eggerthella guodeyinii]QOS67955.1 hypothetical protein GS424_015865 [Eggerthella guodeyinii]
MGLEEEILRRLTTSQLNQLSSLSTADDWKKVRQMLIENGESCDEETAKRLIKKMR